MYSWSNVPMVRISEIARRTFSASVSIAWEGPEPAVSVVRDRSGPATWIVRQDAHGRRTPTRKRLIRESQGVRGRSSRLLPGILHFYWNDVAEKRHARGKIVVLNDRRNTGVL
jgi:hypothetical protein